MRGTVIGRAGSLLDVAVDLGFVTTSGPWFTGAGSNDGVASTRSEL
jgi:hypothetical protein